MEEFKERQAKMSGVQSALQSGDLMGGYVGFEKCRVGFSSDHSCSISQMLAGDEPKAASSGTSKAASSSGAKHRGPKNKRR